MIDQAAGAPSASGTAQPQADANSIDGIIDNAATETAQATQEKPDADPAEPSEADGKTHEEVWSKKAQNAVSRRDKIIGRERALRQQAEAELAKYREQQAPKQPAQAATGEPKEADFQNYADYLEARSDWKLEQRLAERDGKQKETQASAQEQAWKAERQQHVATTAQAFIKENPEVAALVEEHADIVDDYSPELQRLFLEADNAPLAFANLAKEGKLESLASMSLAKAAMEIGRAQTQAYSRPQSKAPAPLPASRGSVASSKSLDAMSGDELLKWVHS